MLISPALANAGANASGSTLAFVLNLVVPLALVFVIFQFLVIRPQQKRMKDHQAKLAAVARGDQVVTGGGLIGKVTKVEADHVEVEIAQGVRVKALKATLTDVTSTTAPKLAKD